MLWAMREAAPVLVGEAVALTMGDPVALDKVVRRLDGTDILPVGVTIEELPA